MGTSFGCADIVDRGKARAAEPDVERRDVKMLNNWGVGERHLIEFSSVLGLTALSWDAATGRPGRPQARHEASAPTEHETKIDKASPRRHRRRGAAATYENTVEVEPSTES